MFSVANMLDRLYKEFDGLSNKYDIFKVETIGDGESGPGLRGTCKNICQCANDCCVSPYLSFQPTWL